MSSEAGTSMLPAVEALVREVARREVTPRFLKVAHSHKADGSLFTEADAATQTALEAALPAIRNVPVLGEEMTEQQQRDAWAAGREGLWCVDPIDGTSNFVAGVPYFAVGGVSVQGGAPLGDLRSDRGRDVQRRAWQGCPPER